MFSNNPVSQSMIDAVNKVLGEAPQAAAPAQPVEQPKNPFAPQLLDESDEKVNPEESKCVTEPKAKEIAKKEVKGHEKKLHQKEDMTFANKLKCSIKEGKATGTEEIFTDNNLGEEEMSDKQKAKREKIVMSMKGDEAGLKQRYGKNWKNVMYATATKQAMKEEVEQVEEDFGTAMALGALGGAAGSYVGLKLADLKISRDMKKASRENLAQAKAKQAAKKKEQEVAEEVELDEDKLGGYSRPTRHKKVISKAGNHIGTVYKYDKPNDFGDTYAASYHPHGGGGFEWTHHDNPETAEKTIHRQHGLYKAAATKQLQKAEKHKTSIPEEVEDLEELDKSTLGSYVNKAAKNVASKAYKSGKAVDPKTGHNKDSWSNYDQAKKRLSGIDKAVSKLSKEEVEQVEEATPPKNTDIADKSYLKHKPGTVKGTMTQLGRFLRGKPEIKEDVEVQIDKSVDKITTDMLSGRVSGGKLNSFRNYKVDLKTSGEEPVPVECDKGTDTKEKQKISTNPGPVDIKLDDNLTTSPQSHFSDDKQIKNEEVKPELKHIRNKEGKMRDQEVTDFANKHTPGGLVKSNEELELEEKVIAGTDGWEKSPKNVKDKSGAVHTPMSRAKDLARQSFKKIKSDLGKNK